MQPYRGGGQGGRQKPPKPESRHMALRMKARRESREQAIDKPGAPELLSIVPLLFLDWRSIGPLLIDLFSHCAAGVPSGRPPCRRRACGAIGEACFGRYSTGITFFQDDLTEARGLGSMRTRINHRFST